MKLMKICEIYLGHLLFEATAKFGGKKTRNLPLNEPSGNTDGQWICGFYYIIAPPPLSHGYVKRWFLI